MTSCIRTKNPSHLNSKIKYQNEKKDFLFYKKKTLEKLAAEAWNWDLIQSTLLGQLPKFLQDSLLSLG